MLITSCSGIIPLLTPTTLLHCKRKAHFYPSNPVPLASHIFLVFQFHHQFSYTVMSGSLWPHGLQTPGLPVPHHQLTQTHIHWVGHAIQSSHPLLSPSPLSFNLSQHQGLFKWVNTLATWYKELTHLKRPWCWERLKERGEGDNRGWDGWMASPTQ